LTDVIGLSWSKAHDEAERLEHAISPEVEALLLKRFGSKRAARMAFPCAGESQSSGSKAPCCLRTCRQGSAEIVCVHEKDAQFLEFLEGLRLRPSTTVEC